MITRNMFHFAPDDGGAAGAAGAAEGKAAAAGAAGAAGAGAEAAGKAGQAADAAAAAGKTYTAEELNGLLTRKETEATTKLLKELGYESSGNLKADLKKLKEIQDKDKTEAQKAADLAAENAKKATDAEARAVAAETKAEALALGVDPKKIERAVKLIPAYDGETPAKKVEAFLAENPEFKADPAAALNFGAKGKEQGGDAKAAARDALEKAMGVRPAKAAT